VFSYIYIDVIIGIVQRILQYIQNFENHTVFKISLYAYWNSCTKCCIGFPKSTAGRVSRLNIIKVGFGNIYVDTSPIFGDRRSTFQLYQLPHLTKTPIWATECHHLKRTVKVQNDHSLHKFYSRASLSSHFPFVAYDPGLCPYGISLNHRPLRYEVKKAYDLSCSGRTVALYWSSYLLVTPEMPCVFDGFEIWLRARVVLVVSPATRATLFNKSPSDWFWNYIYYDIMRRDHVSWFDRSPRRSGYCPRRLISCVIQQKIPTRNGPFSNSIC